MQTQIKVTSTVDSIEVAVNGAITPPRFLSRAWRIGRGITRALVILFVATMPLKGFSQSCATTPDPLVWQSGSWGTQFGTGSASLICAAEVADGGIYQSNGGRYVWAVASCSAPLPASNSSTATVTFVASPTPYGVSTGFTNSFDAQDILVPYGNTACPLYWVSAIPPILADVQCHDCVADPINPAVGNVYLTEEDVEFEGAGVVGFRRFYNSADATGIDAVLGWRHTYDRYINAVYQSAATLYPGKSTQVSPQYSTPAAACTSGFPAIQASVGAWVGATASYANVSAFYQKPRRLSPHYRSNCNQFHSPPRRRWNMR